MRLDKIETYYEKGETSLLLSTRKIKVYQALLDTGAIVEQGVVFRTKYFYDDEKVRLEKENEENNTMPLLPYVTYERAYCPTVNQEETLDLYKAVKECGRIDEELDIRQYDSLKKKIDAFALNMFWGRENGSISAKLKGATFFLWTFSGTLNVMSDRAGLAALQYFCAVLQIDFFELVPMITASTISPEKKKTILETIKNHYINPEAIRKKDKYIGLYTKIDSEDEEKILRRIR